MLLAALGGGGFAGDILFNRLARDASFLLARGVGLITQSLPVARSARTFGSLVGLALLPVVFLLFIFSIRPGPDVLLTTTNVGGGMILEHVYRLPDAPLSLVFRDDQTGYLGFNEGTIASFRVPDRPGDNLNLKTVVEDVIQPRGMVILNDVLFVTTQGPRPEIRR